MAHETERMRILEMIDSGTISAQDGLRLLEALGAGEEETTPEAPDGLLGSEQDSETLEFTLDEAVDPDSRQEGGENTNGVFDPSDDAYIDSGAAPLDPGPHLPPDANKWRQWWILPFLIAVAVMTSGAVLMARSLQTAEFSIWFVCASVPFVIGLLVLVLAWQSRTAPWLHLRIQQKPGERPGRIAFSFPIPIKLTAWFLRNFGSKIPQLEETSLDEVLLAVGETTSPDNPIYIQVDEGDDGEKVEIFIG